MNYDYIYESREKIPSKREKERKKPLFENTNYKKHSNERRNEEEIERLYSYK